MERNAQYERLSTLIRDFHALFEEITQGCLTRECQTFGLREPLCVGDYQFLALVEKRGSLSMAQAAKELRINPSSATRQVNRLLHCGLITKSAVPDDDRKFSIQTTPLGTTFLNRLYVSLSEVSHALLGQVSDEDLQTVCDFLEARIKVLHSIQQDMHHSF